MWRYLSRNDAAPRIAGISHRMIIIQKQKDFVIDPSVDFVEVRGRPWLVEGIDDKGGGLSALATPLHLGRCAGGDAGGRLGWQPTREEKS
jgi:hypothetical protein